MAAHPKNYLLIVNDAPYGNERPYNALRLALNLVKRPDIRVRVSLTGDGVNCAMSGRKRPVAVTTPRVNGYPTAGTSTMSSYSATRCSVYRASINDGQSASFFWEAVNLIANE